MAMSSVFPKRYLYENGNVNVYSKSEFMKTGTLTLSEGTKSGSLPSIYDLDTTSYYQLSVMAGDANLSHSTTWDFRDKKLFYNVYVYASQHFNAAGQTGSVKLFGSQNNVDWTELDTFSTSGVDEVSNSLLGTSATYRYFKVQWIGTSGAREDRLYIVEGVV